MKRREWWLSGHLACLTLETAKRLSKSHGRASRPVRVQESLLSDPSPEWVDELIEYAAGVVRANDADSLYMDLLRTHLAKRGEK